MRVTLTLDDDIAARLKAETRRTGKSFRDVVNKTLRRGLASQRAVTERRSFKVVSRDLGDTVAGLSLDGTAGLIEQIEGPFAR